MDYIGQRRPTSHRVHWVPSWPRRERRATNLHAGKPPPITATITKCSPGRDPAPGGAYDYMVRGQMIGGFAMVAYPAQYGSSGIMTFIVNHDGVVYQKDLGRAPRLWHIP